MDQKSSLPVLIRLILIGVLLSSAVSNMVSTSLIGNVRINGGDFTDPKRVPYHALVLKEGFLSKSPIHSGVILSENMVLTSLHYLIVQTWFQGNQIIDPKTIFVSIGAKSTKKALLGDLYTVKEIILQPGWKRSYIFKDHKLFLAIIVLDKPFVMSSREFNASSVTLARKSYGGQKGLVSGYEETSIIDFSTYPRLKSVMVPILSQKQMESVYKPYASKYFIGAGYLTTNDGPCSTLDHGGPLVVKEGDRYVLVGVAIGIYCFEYPPAIFANITFHRDWIETVMREKNSVKIHI